MATTKTATAMWNAQALAAGTPQTSAAVDLTDGYGGVVDIKVTNGATGPTLPAQVQVQVSEDNSKWYDLGGPLVAQTGNSIVTSWGGIIVPMGTKYLRLYGSGNTAQTVTLDADLSEVSAI